MLQLPLLWSVELVIIYFLLAFLKPGWINIPVQLYFILIGMQTLYSYVKAKLSVYATQEISTKYQKVLSGLIVLMTVFFYVLHFIPDVPKNNALYWISGNSIGYTLLIKLISSVQIGKVHFILLLFVIMIAYDCFFVFKTDIMITVASGFENPMKFIVP